MSPNLYYKESEFNTPIDIFGIYMLFSEPFNTRFDNQK